MQALIDAVVDRALSEKKITGTVVSVMKDGIPVYKRAAGFADREAGKPVQFDTIFRLASVTKPLVAATVLALIEKGKLGLDDLARDHLPYFQPKTANGRIADIKIRHLLTHTAGFTYDMTPADLYPEDQRVSEGLTNTDLGFEENFTRLAAVPLKFEPGTAWAYSTAIDVLGAIIARIENTSLHDALQTYVAGPLRLADTGFFVTDPERLATPYADAKPEPVRMNDPHTVVTPAGWAIAYSPSRAFNPKAFQSGGAGAVSTPRNILTFLEAIRTSRTILSPEMTKTALSNQTGNLPLWGADEGQRFSFLGAYVLDSAIADTELPTGAVSWGGVYGHSWFIDQKNGMIGLIMTNNAVEGVSGQYPRDIYRAIYAA